MALSRDELLELKKQFGNQQSSLPREELLELKKQFSSVNQEQSQNVQPQNSIKDSNPLLAIGRNIENETNGKEAQDVLSNFARAYAFWQGGRNEIGKISSGATKLAAYAPDKLAGTNLGAQVPDNFLPPSPMAQEAMQAYPGAAYAGSMIPAFTPLGVEAKAVQMAARYSPAMRFLAKTTGRGVEGGVIGAAYNPDHPIEGGTIGSLVGSASVPVEKAILNIPEGLAKLAGSKATSEEARRNVEAAKAIGAKLPLGQATQAPMTTSLQSSLSYVPGSGQAAAYMDIGNSIKNSINDVLDEIKPESSVKLNKNLVNTLSKASENAENKKTTLYTAVSEVADKTNDKVSMDRYVKEAKKELNQIEKFSKDNKEFEDIYDPSLSGKLKSIIKNDPLESKILDKSGNPYKIPVDKERSFGAAFDLDKRLNDAIATAKGKNDRASLSVLRSLKTALNKDINDSAMASTNQELVNSWIDAKQHFKNEVVPLRDKKIKQFIDGEKSSERIIPTFLKGGQFEQPEFLSKLTSHLSPKQKQSIAHEYLTHGMREIKGSKEIKEGKVLQNYEKMGDEVKKDLLSPAQREILDNALITKKNMNLDLNQMVQPKTGASLTKATALAGSAATGFVASGVANVMRRLLANPRLIEGYIRQMEKAEGKRPKPILTKAAKPIKPVSKGVSAALSSFLTGQQ